MKKGSLVRHKNSESIGVVLENLDKKVWRTHVQGKRINWDKVEPEPHSSVLFSHNDGPVEIPWVDLVVIDEEG